MDDMNMEDFDEFFKTLVLHQDVIYRIKLSSEKLADYKDEYFAYKEREKTEGRDVVIKELRDKLKSFADRDDCDKRVVTTWGRSNLRTYSIDWVQEPKFVKFEDTEFAVPTKSEACLRLQYGYDWYMIPENAEQITHDLCINPDISYNNYYADMDQFIDWDPAFEAIDISKRVKIENLDIVYKIRRFWQEATACKLLMRYESSTDEDRLRLAEEDRYGFLETMQPFLVYRGSFAGAGMTDKVSDAVLAEWLKQLILSGRYYHAIKVARAFAGGRTDESVKSMLELLESVKKLAACWQDRDIQGINTAMAEIPAGLQNELPDCILAKGRIHFEDGDDPESRDRLIDVCGAYLKKYPENYDVMKLLGDLLWSKGDEDVAMELYRKVNDGSRNGLDLLDLMDRFGFEPGYLNDLNVSDVDDEE